MLESADAEDLVLTYLRHYWISYNGPTIEKQLAAKIREKIVGRQQAVDMSIALSENAVHYAALFSPLEHTGWQQFDKNTRGYLYVMMRILQVVQIRPLILSVIRHFDHVEAKKAFKLFLSWSVRFLIAGSGSGGALDQHYGLRAKEIADGAVTTANQLADRMKGIVRTDDEFRDGLERARVSKKHLARYYLRCLELKKAGMPNCDLGGVLEDTTVYNLEHVIPLNPSGSWPLQESVVQSYSRRLGNMVLLDPTVNVDIGNKDFPTKCAIFLSGEPTASDARGWHLSYVEAWRNRRAPEEVSGYRRASMDSLDGRSECRPTKTGRRIPARRHGHARLCRARQRGIPGQDGLGRCRPRLRPRRPS
jgi:hypothetical protein